MRASPTSKQCVAFCGLTLLLVSSCSSVGPADSTVTGSPTVEVQLLAFNDFHGNIEAPTSGLPFGPPDANGKSTTIPSGGVARLATLIKQRAATQPHTIVVGAGDLIGASPLLSSRFHDEPAIEALSSLGLVLSAVGNHEFDEGLAELRRMQTGGCHPKDGCQGPAPFKGAGFQYLAANVIEESTNQPIFPASVIREFDGIPVGFIGLTLTGTPSLLPPSVRTGLQFLDEATTINREAAALHADGVEAIVVLIHEGAEAGSGADVCSTLSGAITTIVPKLDSAIDIVVSGHTHNAYDCELNGMLLTSAGQYGTRLTDIAMTLDRASGDIVQASADNVLVAAALPEDPAIASLVASYRTLAEPLLQREVGSLAAPLDRNRTPGGEFPMGSVVADAMVAAAATNTGEKIEAAFMNPGGVRGEISHPGPVRFAELFTVQPFSNTLTVLTMTGAQLEAVLKQQFIGDYMRILQVSEGFRYQWRQRGESGELVAGSVRINGEPLQAERRYRIATNNFVAEGGDGFTAFADGTDSTPAGGDVEALEAYLAARPNFAPPAPGRITLAP
ncbi:MAG: bifunctional metallophosphatase/5'-nucleotidase [Pseudomonadota bacterium]